MRRGTFTAALPDPVFEGDAWWQTVSIHDAAAENDADAVRQLLAASLDPQSEAAAKNEQGFTPLAVAAAYGSVEAAAVLLELAPESAGVRCSERGLLPLHAGEHPAWAGWVGKGWDGMAQAPLLCPARIYALPWNLQPHWRANRLWSSCCLRQIQNLPWQRTGQAGLPPCMPL